MHSFNKFNKLLFLSKNLKYLFFSWRFFTFIYQDKTQRIPADHKINIFNLWNMIKIINNNTKTIPIKYLKTDRKTTAASCNIKMLPTSAVNAW